MKSSIVYLIFILFLGILFTDSTKVNLRYKKVTSSVDSLDYKVKMIKSKLDSLQIQKQRKK